MSFVNKNNLLAVGALIVIAAVIGGIEITKPNQSNTPAQEIVLDANERREAKAKQFDTAKEITTPDGFINSPIAGIDQNQTFTLADYIGEKVVLVEFWTYSCINCQRVIPFLNNWHKKYEDEGLVIVGIHTPEFEFEKDFENVQQAVEKYDVEWPVVLDNDYSTWRAYNNRYWPRKYLIDIDGFVVYDHIGEGAYEETEAKIVELLNERKQVLGEEADLAVKGGEVMGVQEVDFEQVGTHETYLGASRIRFIRNLPRTTCLTESCDYSFNGDSATGGYELEGTWLTEPETITLESSTGALRMLFTASKVNLVAGAPDGQTVRARILVDGEEVNQVTFTDEHDLYNLVDLNGSYETHILEIQFEGPGIAAFAFTFG